ncbi:MAG TPA: HD-GYP domain-containing protein [Burkholderiaceae bacterium]|jgi:putative nucleotidyltransferase with HDIG domain
MVLKTVPIQQLRAGMFLHQVAGSWMDHPFWRSRFTLRGDGDLEKLRDNGIREVVIDTERGLDIDIAVEPRVAVDEPQAAVAPPPVLAQVGGEYVDAARLCAKSLEVVSAVFREARLGRAVDAQACLPLVEEIVESVMTSQDTLVTMARIKTADTYTYMHAVAVSTLMIALARQIGLPAPLIREAGLAGLLHDIGKVQMPTELLGKNGRLNEKELALMRTHALRGKQLLVEGGSAGAAVLDTALHHHERADGSGYPDRLSGDKISLFARMGAVCDVYDAVTSRRPYRAPWDPGEAMREMAQAKGQFSDAVFQSFVKAVGIYPTGSLVRMQSEKLAVVIGQSKESLLTPRLKVFYDVGERHLIQPFELDLSDSNRTDRIAGVEPPGAWRFPDLEKLWLRGE